MIYYFRFKNVYNRVISDLIIHPGMIIRGKDLHRFIIENYHENLYREKLYKFEEEKKDSFIKYKRHVIVIYFTSIDIKMYNIQYE